MTKSNPFPGMNPFLERYWSDVHTKLIAYIPDAIAEDLPPDLNARSEERVTMHEPGGDQTQLRADVAVVESWKQGVRPQWKPESGTDAAVATEPQIISLTEETERWIEITDKHGHLITVVEVLIPSNKTSASAAYIARRDMYLNAKVNLVEIDLLRTGQHVLAASTDHFSRPVGSHYISCVSRMTYPQRREVYVTALRDPLPTLRIPSRATDSDVILALQPLVDRCYRMGAYWNVDQTNVPAPALAEEEATWVAERVMAAGLING
jgi:hypothetical protein